MQWLGIVIALLFWVAESAIDAFIFDEGSFSQRLISPDPNETWMRFFITIIILGFGFFAQRAFKREEKAHVKSLENSENRFREIFDHSNEAIFLFDPVQSEILEINKKAYLMFGFTREELLAKNISDILQGEAFTLRVFIQPLFENKGEVRAELVCRTKDGNRLPTTISASLMDLRGRICVNVRVRDATEQKQIEKLERLSNIVFENVTEAIMVTDANGLILSINPAFTEISGYSEEEVIGKNPRVFQSGKHDHVFFKEMWEILNTTGHWEGEIWDRRKNGESYPKWLSITEVKDENGNIIQYTGLFTDITERKKQEEELYYRANYDHLTGLVKRALLSKYLREAIEEAVTNHCKAAVFFIDLDKFKRVNDSMGHSVGDELLKVAANRLGSCIRGNDVLARSGGDEFLIVLADIFDHEEIVIVAERILDKFSRPFHLDGEDVFVGTSIGIAISPEDGKEVLELINKADQAMYQVKTSGGNNFLFHSKEGIEADSKIA